MFENMTLKEKIYQTIIADNHAIKLAGGPEKFFAEYPVGGFYFMRGYVNDLGALMEEGVKGSEDLIRKCREYSKTDLLVCADGALIANGHDMSLGGAAACEDENVYFKYGEMRGIEMNYHDIDWILTPCIDLDFARHDHTSLMITDDPVFCGKFFSKVVEGIQSRGVIATAKHFPGQGSYNVNFHYAPGRNTLDFDTWMKNYGYTYKEMFKSGCLSVMTSHIVFPDYCYESEDGYPPICTFSKKMTIDLLKGTLGFEGAVVTDALTMGGMSCGNTAKESAQAFKCGADLLLWAPVETADIIEEMIASGEIPMSRLDDALSRIAKLREFVKANKKKCPENAGELVDAFAKKTYELGPELLKNRNGALPLKKNDKILVIANGFNQGQLDAVKEFSDILSERGYDVTFREYLLTCYQDEINAIIDGYDKILIVLNHPMPVIETNYSSTTWAGHLVDKSRKVIVNFSNPFLAEDFYPDEPCVVNTNTRINKESASAVIDKLCGEKEFTGKAHFTMKYIR